MPLYDPRYTDAEAIAAVEGEPTLDLSGQVSVADTMYFDGLTARFRTDMTGGLWSSIGHISGYDTDQNQEVVRIALRLWGHQEGGGITFLTRRNGGANWGETIHFTQDGTIFPGSNAFSPTIGLTSDRWANAYTDALDVANDIVVGGTVDGVDIAAHAVDVDAHHAKYTDAEAIAAVEAEPTLDMKAVTAESLSSDDVILEGDDAAGGYDRFGTIEGRDAGGTARAEIILGRDGTGNRGRVVIKTTDASDVHADRVIIGRDGSVFPAGTAQRLGTSGSKWSDLYLSGDITVDGLVDGVDIAAHAADPDAHHTHGGAPVVRAYTAGATWTKPAGLAYALVEVQGAGGGGGGAASTGGSQGAGGGGGGGGGYARKLLTASDLSSLTTATVTVGSGGSGGSGSGSGSSGGTSSFAGTGITTVSGAGGGGGTGCAAGTGNLTRAGGGGGTGSGGDINIKGGGGSNGMRLSLPGVSAAIGLPFAHGGAGQLSTQARPNSTLGANAYNGSAYGNGGTGAANASNDSSSSGGDGADGVVIVTEYYE